MEHCWLSRTDRSRGLQLYLHLHDTVITSTFNGITASQRTFVPQGAMYDVTSLTLTNNGDSERVIDLFPYVPINISTFAGGSMRHQVCNFNEDLNGLFAESVSPNKPSELYNAFITSSAEVVGSRGNNWELFRGIYGPANPDINTTLDPIHMPGHVDRMCLFIRNSIRLAPGESVTVHFACGLAESLEQATEARAFVSDDQAVEAAHQAVAKEFDDLTHNNRIDTGTPVLDAIMNHWIKKQMRSYLCYKNAYRDSLQIDMAYSMVDPEHAINNAVDVISHLYIDGHAPHSCRPLITTYYSDKPTWLLMTFPAIIKETGDLSILDREVPYLNLDGSPTSNTTTVWEHLQRTMRYLSLDVGDNGLCRMHHADWNDGLDSLRGDGESVLTSLFFCAGLKEFAELCDFMGEDKVAAEARSYYYRMSEVINTVAWDGQWYIRGITGSGRRIGGKDSDEGRIFVNSQSWAIISGVANEERTKIILEQCDQQLENPLGMQVAAPLYTKADPDIGTMSANPPGIAENGVYLHASGFNIVANCLAKRGEDAWRIMGKVMPNHPDNPLSQSRNLPFAVTNSWRGADSMYGMTGSPWRTGTSGWIYQAMQEYIIGIRREYTGLLIDPCLPAELDHITVTREFRGATYNITINNYNNGPATIEVDGQPYDSHQLPLAAHGSEMNVVVTIGTAT